MLITVVDDYGCYDADHNMLRRVLYPYDDPGEEEFGCWMTELYDAKLICRYQVDGFWFLWLPRLKERIRSVRKFPVPPFEEAEDLALSEWSEWLRGRLGLLDKHGKRGKIGSSCPTTADNCGQLPTTADNCGQLPTTANTGEAQARRRRGAGEAQAIIQNASTITMAEVEAGIDAGALDDPNATTAYRLRQRAIRDAAEAFYGRMAFTGDTDDERDFGSLVRKHCDRENPNWTEFIQRVKNAKTAGAKTFADLQAAFNQESFDRSKSNGKSDAGRIRDDISQYVNRGQHYDKSGAPVSEAAKRAEATKLNAKHVPNNGKG